MTTTTSSPKYPVLPSKLILTSTKAYFSPSQTCSYLQSLLDPKNDILPLKKADVLFALIPDFLSIHSCNQLLNAYASHNTYLVTDHPCGWPIHLGAQDAFWSTTYGAYTGEIIPSALQEFSITIVELGHAERRKLLSETDETTALKATAVSHLGMIPLVCIGETNPPPESGPMSAAVGTAMRQLNPQILSLLKAIPLNAPVIFAYEPVWAIGKEKPAGVEYVGPVVQGIRALVKEFENKNGRTGQTKVVYGGSAGPGLWSGSSNGGNPLGKWVDGMFLGRFAHEIPGVKKVVDEVLESMDA